MRGGARAFAAAALAWIGAGGCGPKQVCECAVLAGGTVPASEAEAAYRSGEVDQCLARHGGGTTTGCPQPAGMPPMSPAAPSVLYSSPALPGATPGDPAGEATGQQQARCPDAS